MSTSINKHIDQGYKSHFLQVCLQTQSFMLQDFDFITKCQSIADGKRLSFDSSFFQMNPQLINQILKAYSEKLIFSGETNAEKYLQEMLISLSAQMKGQNVRITNQNNPSVQTQPLTMIIVNQERDEHEYENQWKEARKNFFCHQIKQKISQNQNLEKHQTEIIQGFMKADQSKFSHRLSISFGNTVASQIMQIEQSLMSINQSFYQSQKENPKIAQIIKLKLTQLQVISLKYSLDIDQNYRYQVLAFALFKVVHENKGLSSVTLKGVKVKQFQCFIRQMTHQRLNQIEWNNEKRSWMKEFKPSKLLKIAIDTEHDFQSTNKQWDLFFTKYLAQFVGLFKQVSVISVKFRLNSYKQLLTKGGNTLRLLQEQLKMMENVKLKIKIDEYYAIASSDYSLFTMFLYMLSSLTTITQLQFMDQIQLMEQILRIIFQNNAVTHLELGYCQNFPIFPTITNLQTIVLSSVSFRRQLLSELAQSSPSLQSITYRNIKQEWRVKEEIFYQIKRLQIQDCQNFSQGFFTHSPLNIKCLAIYGSSILRNVNGLSALFPKLAHITQLSLSSIDLRHQIICTIPSPHLAYLKIEKNNEFENQGLEAIDKNWPKLRYLTLQYCSMLNERGWKACEFNGLVRLQIDPKILKIGHQIRQQFRRKGVRVYNV